MNVTTRVPIGPVGVITPWNTPFMLSTWKIAPALAAGCTVVHKPAEFSPLTARILMEIAEEAGLPKGVWNLVNGHGDDAGKALTEHPDIKAIAFVGESRTGSMIMKQGADTLKRVHFELGGKNPVIVFDDADVRHLQLNFTRLGVKGSLIAARPSVLTPFIALITASSAKTVCLCVQHRVQRLFNGATHHLSKMILDPTLIDPDHIAHLFALIVISHAVLPSITIKGTVST